MSFDEQEPIEPPVDGTLDLHTFDPREVGDLIPDYIGECLAREILQVRIIHGKGTGAMRERVHAILGRLSSVSSYRLAGENGGGWGSTIVTLRRPAGGDAPGASAGKDE